jgi:hypothetical protein
MAHAPQQDRAPTGCHVGARSEKSGSVSVAAPAAEESKHRASQKQPVAILG